jgi:hypothetical protein
LQVFGDAAHSGRFLLELAAFHAGVLLALEVGEQAVGEVGVQRVGGDEHAGLRHELG